MLSYNSSTASVSSGLIFVFSLNLSIGSLHEFIYLVTYFFFVIYVVANLSELQGNKLKRLIHSWFYCQVLFCICKWWTTEVPGRWRGLLRQPYVDDFQHPPKWRTITIKHICSVYIDLIFVSAKIEGLKVTQKMKSKGDLIFFEVICKNAMYYSKHICVMRKQFLFLQQTSSIILARTYPK